MPRTRTIKKGNRKGNRNVSRGNKYTLNRLKERNHKRKKTRLRRGLNRNNYNNLPKRTRKQRAGSKMNKVGDNVKRSMMNKVGDYVKRKTSITQAASETKPAVMLGDQLKAPATVTKILTKGTELGARALVEDVTVGGIKVLGKGVGKGYDIASKALAFKIDRPCKNEHDFKVSILFEGDKESEDPKIPGLPQKKGRTICGKTYFQDLSLQEDTLNDVKEKLRQDKKGGLLVKNKSEIKKIGMNTIKIPAQGIITDPESGEIRPEVEDYIVVLAPVDTNKDNLKKKNIQFKTGSDKREADNIRNFFFYNVLAPMIFTLPKQGEEDQIRSRIREELDFLKRDEEKTDKGTKIFPISESIVEYFVKKQKTNTYLDLKLNNTQKAAIVDAYRNPNQDQPKAGGGPLTTLKKGLKVLKKAPISDSIKKGLQRKPKVRIDFNNRNTAQFSMILVLDEYRVAFRDLKSGNYKRVRDELRQHIFKRYNDSDTKGEIDKYTETDEDRIGRQKEKQLMNIINSLAIELNKEVDDKNKNRNIDNILSELTGKILKNENEGDKSEKEEVKNENEGDKNENEGVKNKGVIKTVEPGEITLNKLCSNFGTGKNYHEDYGTVSDEDLKAFRKHFHTPIISGMDYHKPSLIKGLIRGAQNPLLQKRFFAIFTDDVNQAKVKREELEAITEAYGKIGVIISSRNSENFIKDEAGNIKILSFANAEINQRTFSAFLKKVVNTEKFNFEPFNTASTEVKSPELNILTREARRQYPEKTTEVEDAEAVAGTDGVDRDTEVLERPPERPPEERPSAEPPAGGTSAKGGSETLKLQGANTPTKWELGTDKRWDQTDGPINGSSPS